MSKIDLPKDFEGMENYDKLNNALDSLSSSEYIDGMKKEKLDIINKNFQVEYIDEKLDNLDLDSLKTMPIFESDLEVEIKEALQIEIDKTPETIRDDIYRLEESNANKYIELNENIDYLHDAMLYAQSYNKIVNSQLEYIDIENIPESVVETYNKNESVLFVTGGIDIVDGNIRYTDNVSNLEAFDLEANFESSLNDISTIIESSRKVIDDGLDIENYDYLNESIYEKLYDLAAYSVDDKNLEIKSEKLFEFIEDKNSYIKENIPDLEIDLKELVSEIENALDVDIVIELDDQKIIEEVKEAESLELEDDGFELDF